MAQASTEESNEDKPRKLKKIKRTLEPLNEIKGARDSNTNLARALGSVDWRTREQGLQALTTWLTRNTVVEKDLMRIWKALYFCFWHSDKAHIQVSCVQSCCEHSWPTLFSVRMLYCECPLKELLSRSE